MNILESLNDKLLVADGAFGTCYVGMYGEQGTVAPELANIRYLSGCLRYIRST